MNRYQQVLQVKEELVEEIFKRDVVAKKYISDEICLSLSSDEENLNMLLGLTLFRDDYDRSPLKDEEIKILKESYNISYISNDIILGVASKILHQKTTIEKTCDCLKDTTPINEDKLSIIIETAACTVDIKNMKECYNCKKDNDKRIKKKYR